DEAALIGERGEERGRPGNVAHGPAAQIRIRNRSEDGGRVRGGKSAQGDGKKRKHRKGRRRLREKCARVRAVLPPPTSVASRIRGFWSRWRRRPYRRSDPDGSR